MYPDLVCRARTPPKVSRTPFTIMRSLVLGTTAVAVALFVSACNGDSERLSAPTLPGTSSPAHQLSASTSAVRTIYGPHVFTRDNGAPAAETFTLAGYAPTATLHIVNGTPDAQHRVTSATINVDGVDVVRESDFKKSVAELTVPITLANPSTVSVQLAGQPGSQVTISIEGSLSVGTVHVCPTFSTSGTTFPTIGDAVAVVPANDTLRLCNGNHAAESVAIDRTLTFLPEPGATAAIRNSTTSAAIVLDSNSAGGTVSFRGVNFRNDAPIQNTSTVAARELGSYSIRAHSSPLSLVVTSATLAANASANGSIFVFRSPTAATAVTVDSVTFDGGAAHVGEPFVGGAAFGIYTDTAGTVTFTNSHVTNTTLFAIRTGGAFVTVRGNTASNCGNTCIVITAGPTLAAVPNALVESDTATDCGVLSCVNVTTNFAAGSATVRRNVFSTHRVGGPLSGGNRHVINFSAGVNGGSIEDNAIDGCGFGQCILAWGGGSVTIANNHITAYAADQTRIGIAVGDGAFGNSTAVQGIDANVHDNEITGVGGNIAAAPLDSMSYPMHVSGIHIESHRTATVDRNTLNGAWFGIFARKASTIASGSDNRVDQTRTSVAILDAGTNVTLHGNDFTTTTSSILQSANSGNSLTCNWWGAVTGPKNVASSQGATLFTPWSIAPVANGGGAACTGGTP
jgi:hypothetical protein